MGHNTHVFKPSTQEELDKATTILRKDIVKRFDTYEEALEFFNSFTNENRIIKREQYPLMIYPEGDVREKRYVYTVVTYKEEPCNTCPEDKLWARDGYLHATRKEKEDE